MTSDTVLRDYTFVFSAHIDDVGMVGVVIMGIHDGNSPNFVPLDHERIPVHVTEDAVHPITNAKLKNELNWLVTTYLYVTEGDIVTSDCQVTEINAGQPQLDVSNYGQIDITPLGTIWVQEDEIDGLYYLAIANPSQGVYLFIIQEILDENSVQRCAINMDNRLLIESIICQFLNIIGAIDTEDEGENFH